MSDNTTLNPGSGGDTMRDKDRAGVKTGIIGLDLGIGTGTEVLMAGAMPVTGTFWQTTQPVSGTLTVNAGTNLNTSLLALESGGNLGTLASTVSASKVNVNIPGTVGVTQSGSWSVVVTDSVALAVGAAQVGSWSVSVTGSVAVTGTFWQATQPVSGTITANQGGSWSVSIGAALPAGTNVIGHVIIDSGVITTVSTVTAVTSITNPVAVTGTFWQATQPISGTVTANAGTNLNTSLLALEAGGNLAILAGAIYAQASTTSGQSGPLIQAACTTLAPVYSGDNNKTVPLSIDTTGNLRATSYQSGVWTVQIGNTPNTTPILATPQDPAATTGNITVIDSGTSSTTGQNGQVIITGTPTASSFVSCTFNGHTSYSVQITGTWTGTLSFDRSIDGGTTWTQTSITLYGPSGVGTTYAGSVSSVTLNCLGHGSVGGDTQIRVRATAAMSGTAAIRIQPGFGTGLIAVAQAATNSVYNAMLASVPLYAKISLSATGTVVAAVSGKQIVIIRWSASANGNVNVNWQSHTTTSVATGPHYMTQYASAGGAYCPIGIFATVAGEALDLALSASIAVGGEITYILV